MNTTTINGVVLNERISQKLSFLQKGYAAAIASGLDDAIGYLLEEIGNECTNPQKLINVLSTLHNAKTELLNLLPLKQEGGAQ